MSSNSLPESVIRPIINIINDTINAEYNLKLQAMNKEILKLKKQNNNLQISNAELMLQRAQIKVDGAQLEMMISGMDKQIKELSRENKKLEAFKRKTQLVYLQISDLVGAEQRDIQNFNELQNNISEDVKPNVFNINQRFVDENEFVESHIEFSDYKIAEGAKDDCRRNTSRIDKQLVIETECQSDSDSSKLSRSSSNTSSIISSNFRNKRTRKLSTQSSSSSISIKIRDPNPKRKCSDRESNGQRKNIRY